MSKHEKRFLLVLFLSFTVVPAAQAYLDPGTGAFIIQTIVAALIGAAFMLRSYWARIKSWFVKKENGPQKNSKQPETSADEAADVSVDGQEKK